MRAISWSGLKAQYTLKYVDGTETKVRTGVPDALRWEANNQGKSLLGAQSVTAMLTVVFYALRRQKLTDVVYFDEWVATLDDFGKDSDEDDVDVDPTSPDQSAD